MKMFKLDSIFVAINTIAPKNKPNTLKLKISNKTYNKWVYILKRFQEVQSEMNIARVKSVQKFIQHEYKTTK